MESPACSSIKLSSLCLAVGMALANPVLAQEPDSHFEEVVVWGTKVSSNTESMFADDMSLKQADHMSDLLRDIPGVMWVVLTQSTNASRFAAWVRLTWISVWMARHNTRVCSTTSVT